MITRVIAYLVAGVAVLLPFGDALEENAPILVAQSLLLLGIVLAGVSLAFEPVKFRITIADVLVLIYLAMNAAALFAADYMYAGVTRLIGLSTAAALYFLVRWLIERKAGDIPRTLRGALLITTTLSCVSALAVYIAEGERARGVLTNPNTLAAFAIVGLAMALPSFTAERSQKRRLAIEIALSALILITIVLTESRSGLIAAGIAIFLHTFHARRYKLLAAGLLVLMAIALLGPVRDKILHPLKADALAFKRVDIFAMDLRIVRDHPVLGIGPGQFPWYTFRYNFPQLDSSVLYSHVARSAHCDILHAFVELGVPAGFVFLSLQVLPVIVLLRQRPSGIAGRFCISLIALSSHGLFHDLMLSLGLVMLWAALLACMPWLDRRDSWTVQIGGGRWSAAAVSACAGIFAWGAAVWVPYAAADAWDRATRRSADPVAAQSSIQRAIRLVPIHPYYQMGLADLYASYYRRTGDLNALSYALDYFRRAIELNPNDWVLTRRVASLCGSAIAGGVRTEEMAAGMRDAFLDELDTNPMQPFALLELARMDVEEAQIANAERKLRDAIALEPSFLRARLELRRLFKARSDWEAYDAQTVAIREIVRVTARERKSDNPYVREILSLPLDAGKEFE